MIDVLLPSQIDEHLRREFGPMKRLQARADRAQMRRIYLRLFGIAERAHEWADRSSKTHHFDTAAAAFAGHATRANFTASDLDYLMSMMDKMARRAR